MQLLRYRPRSVSEARGRLRRCGLADEEIESALQKARDAGLLDDAKFARLWVQDRLLSHPVSRRAVARELSEKGIDERVAEEAMAELYPPEAEKRVLYKLARARYERYRGLDRARRVRRLVSYLTRKGFSFSAAREVVGRLERHPSTESEGQGSNQGS